MTDLEALHRAELSLLGYAGRSRTRRDVGPYALFLAPDPAHRFLNLAVPCEGTAARDADAIATLVNAFERVGAAPALEYMAELHPGLTEALEAAGMHLDSAAPVMTLPLDARALDARAPGVRSAGQPRLLRPRDDALLAAFLQAQARAFAMPDATWQALGPMMRAGLRTGDVTALAWMRGDVPVAGATLLRGIPAGRSGGAVAELAGVWTRADLRRTGLGYATCHALLHAAGEGDTAEAWLSAAQGAEGLYRRLGFRRVGTQHNVRS